MKLLLNFLAFVVDFYYLTKTFELKKPFRKKLLLEGQLFIYLKK